MLAQLYNLIPFFLSLMVSWFVFPKILSISIHKNIVDAPDARKLQKMPVPILGGLVVYSGILVSILAVTTYVCIDSLFTVTCIMTVMLLIGLADDILSLSAVGRLLVEILMILILMISSGLMIDNFYGLWGIYELPIYLSIPLTVIVGVGIINSINLIDGIDGLSSGYCVYACMTFAIFFAIVELNANVYLALAAIGAIIPFYLHNVFGKYSKMFIGDAGTLLLGFVIAFFVISSFKSGNIFHVNNPNFGLIPMLLSVLSVPVFDTLRVMVTRILNGNSPFNPDKTHLHHLFIRLGFTHIGASTSILSLNAFSFILWYLIYSLGFSINVQLYVVVVVNLLITTVLYQYTDSVLNRCQKDANEYSLWIKFLHFIGRKLAIQKGVFLNAVCSWLDKCVNEDERKMLSGK